MRARVSFARGFDVDALGLGGGLQRAARQARQELLRRHVRQPERGADRLAGDPGERPALRAVLPAGQHAGQHPARGLAQQIAVGRQHAAFGERAADRLAVVAAQVAAAVDGDVVAAEGEDQHAEQGVVLDRRVGERLMQRIGAQVADHGDALLRHVRPGPRGRRVVVAAARRAAAAVRAARGLAGLLRLGQPVDDGLDLAGARVDVVPDDVGLAGLAVDASLTSPLRASM